MEIEAFANRLACLREAKGVSAREMSLSIGQSPNYMNGLENGKNFPSMKNFFYICEYLGITPEQFFNLERKNPLKTSELIEVVRDMSPQKIDMLISIAKQFQK